MRCFSKHAKYGTNHPNIVFVRAASNNTSKALLRALISANCPQNSFNRSMTMTNLHAISPIRASSYLKTRRMINFILAFPLRVISSRVLVSTGEPFAISRSSRPSSFRLPSFAVQFAEFVDLCADHPTISVLCWSRLSNFPFTLLHCALFLGQCPDSRQVR